MKLQLMLILILACSCLSAQDTVKLKQVEIHDRSSAFIRHQNSISFDSVTLARYTGKNVAELLNDNSPVFIKSYGNGSMSTISIRGTSSVHTSVLWNGIPINLQSTGDFDISIISVNTFDNIRLVHGGSSSLFGSGSVGGNILLDDVPHFGKAPMVSLENTIGSFGKRSHSASLRLGSSKLSFKAAGYLKELRNDFTFRNPVLEGNPAIKMKNAGISGRGLSSSLFYQHKRSTFALRTWIEEYERNIPVSVFSSSPYSATQKDMNIRNMIEYKFVNEGTVVNAKAAMINTSLSYTDSITKVASSFTSLNIFPEVSIIKTIRKAKLFSGINSSLVKGRNTNYIKQHQRNSIALFTGFNLPLKRSSIALNLREDLFPENENAFTFNATYGYSLTADMKLSASGGRTFRAPSLNDLYWVPGGNASLESEKGWFTQGGYTIEKKLSRQILYFNVTAYSNYVDNWIIWLPYSGSIWTPRNLKKVWSKGIESYLKYNIELKPVRIQINASYSYTEASNESSEDPSVVLHDQIIYVPYYTANGSLDFLYKGLSVRYSHVFVGGRYIASDHSAALPAYLVASARAEYRLSFRDQHIIVFASVNNLYNTDYQVIEQRPMPGRSFDAGLILNLNKP